MKSFLAWWYRISLPKWDPDLTPAERERTRYARLTSAFSLLILCISLPTTVNTIINRVTQTGPIFGVIGFSCVMSAILFNKLGYNRVAAFLLILYVTLVAGGALLRDPLDPAFVPVFCSFVVTIILAGSLMPPIFALLVALMNCIIIILDIVFQQHTAYYDHMLNTGGASLVAALPIALQIIVGVVVYVIMTNLITTIRRADRAEEIVALQKEVMEYQRRRVQEQQQLEERIAVIARVSSAVAGGDLGVRIPMEPEGALWQITVPLNNLLNRVQRWKGNSDVLERTLLAIKNIGQEMQRARIQRAPVVFRQPTETPLDPLLPEIYHLSQQAYNSTRSHLTDGL